MDQHTTPAPEALYQQAMQAYQQGNTTEAENLLRQILTQMPDNDGIMTSLAGLLLSTGKIAEGKAFLEEAIRMNPSNVEARVNLGIAYQNMGQNEEGFQQLSEAVALAPERVDVQLNMANYLLQTGQHAAAIEKLEKVISLNPQALQAYHSLAAVHSYLNQLDQAVTTYEAALQQVPDDLHTSVLLGNTFVAQAAFDKAEALYTDLVARQATHFFPHLVLGKYYLDRGQEIKGKASLLQAHSLNPDEIETNLLLGQVCQTFNQEDDAERYYRRVLVLEPGHPLAQQQLRRMMTTKIPNWHFEMLADTQRNDAYQKAIEKSVNATTQVLDIGTGSGLLAMMAARAGAQSVVACEMHERLAQTAQEIVSLNNYQDQIKVFHKNSNALKIGVELPEKVDLIVSEILDVGGLGEGVLPSIRHAVQQLGKDKLQLIPAKLHFFGQLIEIPARSMVSPVKQISGFDLSPFEKYRVPNEYIKINLKAEKYRALSAVQALWTLDFYELPPIYTFTQPQVIDLSIPILATGSAQAMVFWFDLYLDDEIVVSSRSGAELEHWGQALYCFADPKAVGQGTSLALKMLQSESNIRFVL